MGTCLSSVVRPVRCSVLPEGRKVGLESQHAPKSRWMWWPPAGLRGNRGTAALKPRPAYRWPVREADVCDVILKASGVARGGRKRRGPIALHIKSPLWPWQQLPRRSEEVQCPPGSLSLLLRAVASGVRALTWRGNQL